MKQFLLVFDRLEARLLSCRSYDERAAALRARFAAERMHADNPNVEVVVLGAESDEALKRTHARYFIGTESLYRRSLDKVSLAASREASSIEPGPRV
jgi:hypothetical protein